MIHFLYLIGFAFIVSVCFGVFSGGDMKDKIWIGVKTFLQFVGISLIIAWILYFIPF